jgi:hypothetical protein
VASPAVSRTRIARRVGSASAAKAESSLADSITIWLFNHTAAIGNWTTAEMREVL